MPRGRLPTSTVSVTSSVSPFTTEMELPFSLETKIVIASAGSARGAAQAKAARPALIPFRIGVVLPLVLVVVSFTAARSRTPARRSPGCLAASAGAGRPAAATPRPADRKVVVNGKREAGEGQ